jgi:hypothetical protein
MSTLYRTAAAFVLIGAVWPVGAAEPPGALPGDDAMTCQQIAAELAPYMQQVLPGVTAMANTGQELQGVAARQVAEAMPGAAALTMAATASHADPTGIAGRAVGQAEMNYQQQVWDRSLAESKPLGNKFAAQSGEVMAQGQELQSNARVQRLMQLVQQKNCD